MQDRTIILINFLFIVSIIFVLLLTTEPAYAQRGDSLKTLPLDTIAQQLDDTIPQQKDTLQKQQNASNSIEYQVDYQSQDSMVISMEGEQKIYLYGDAQVVYGDIKLNAAYIEFDMEKNTVFAKGLTDSTGRLIGKPHFKQSDDEFDANNLTYNFKTKRGLIKGVITEQEGGFLHSEITKKHENDEIHVYHGKYTTCDAENPHYYVALSKAKVIPKDKIITGPVYLVIADIPLPIWLPFGYIPNKGKHHSGILIPQYGEERSRGFFLRDGGYYFNINEYVDLKLVGEIYSGGSWGARASSGYKKRYKYSGGFEVGYTRNVLEDDESAQENVNNSYSVRWNHSQDPKAKPNRTFSANVDFKSSNYNNYNSRSSEEYLSNTFGSSVSYNRSWPGCPFNLSANLRHSQNTQTKMVSLTLPSINFNMNRMYLSEFFYKKPGESSFYEALNKISISMTSNLNNTASEPDSLIFSREAEYKNGFQYSVPLSVSMKAKKGVLKHFTLSPSMNYSGVVYPNYIQKHWGYTTPEGEFIRDTLVTDTVRMLEQGISALRHGYSISPNVSLTFNPKVFIFYQFRKPENHRIKVVRHVMTPQISVNYKPEFGDDSRYYKEVQIDTTGATQKYSIFANGIFGTPASSQRAGSVSFSLDNNFEMKMRGKNDTTEDDRKIKLLESFSLRTSYNFFAEQYKWTSLTINGRTQLFNSLNLSFSGSFTPYANDEDGKKLDKYLWDQERRLYRFERAQATLSFSLNKTVSPRYTDNISYYGAYGYDYYDFNLPWNVSINYSYNTQSVFDKARAGYKLTSTQTLGVNGGFSLSTKWKVTFSTGYDFENNKATHTRFGLFRDLHCWEMNFNCVPFGNVKSYNFQINVKASIFKSLKYSKKKSMFDSGL